jgi:hypothetical protein
MATRTFFSFHYGNDVWRASQVRHSWVTKQDTEAAGFLDSVDFERLQKEGDAAIKKWNDTQLSGTSVTAVLIGSDTNKREYVKYELQKSYAKGNEMIGIYIHQIKKSNGDTSVKASNHFGEIGKDSSGAEVYFSTAYPSYDWKDDDGYNNLGKWVEAVAKKACK